jgi:uncharacterized membrane protein YtjA (UPF0391 family)
MKVSAVKYITWVIALVLGVLALLGHYGTIAGLAQYAFWFAIAGLALMLVASVVRNL